jgi:hypothetical protein
MKIFIGTVLGLVLLPFLPHLANFLFNALCDLLIIVLNILSPEVFWVIGHAMAWGFVWLILNAFLGKDSKVLKAYTDISTTLVLAVLAFVLWTLKGFWRLLQRKNDRP